MLLNDRCEREGRVPVMIWYVPAPPAQPVGLVGAFVSVCLVGDFSTQVILVVVWKR